MSLAVGKLDLIWHMCIRTVYISSSSIQPSIIDAGDDPALHLKTPIHILAYGPKPTEYHGLNPIPDLYKGHSTSSFLGD